MEIDLLGAKHVLLVDSEGRLKESVGISSTDGKVALSIEEGATVMDEDGNPLKLVSVEANTTLPAPTEDAHIVGVTYDLRPHGATFDPPLRLTIAYNPQDIPEGSREAEVYVASYDEETGWGVWLYKSVDPKNPRVSTLVSYLAEYAVLISKQPAPSATLDPAFIPLEQALTNGVSTLAEFGRGTCAPCKAMKPILQELAAEYGDNLNVVLVEVDEYMDLTRQFEIMVIPTQIILDSHSEEVMRHIGFWSKEEIIAALDELDIL